MSCLEIDPNKDVIEWTELTDNRDYKAIPSWEPSDRAVTDDLISESFISEQKFLKFRSLTARALAAAVYISEDIHPSRAAAINMSECKRNEENGTEVASGCRLPGTNTSSVNKNVILSDSERANLISPVLKKLICSLEEHINEVVSAVAGEKIDSSSPMVFNKSISGPDTSRLFLYMRNKHNDLLIIMLKLTLAVYKMASTVDLEEKDTATKIATELSNQAGEQFKLMVGNLANLINCNSQEEAKICERSDKLESIVNVTESSSFAAILCGVCQVLLKSGNKFVSDQNKMPNNIKNDARVSNHKGATKSGKKKGGKGGTSSVSSTGSSTEGIKKGLFGFCYVFNELLLNFQSGLTSLLSSVKDFENMISLDQLSVLQTKFSTLSLHRLGQGESVISDKGMNALGDRETKNDSLLDEVQLDILKQMESSYGISFLQIKTVVQNKLNYFSVLKCDTSGSGAVDSNSPTKK